MPLLNVFEECSGRNPQGAGQSHDIKQRNVRLSAFDMADEGAMKVSLVRKHFLGYPTFLTQELQLPTEQNLWILPGHADIIHRQHIRSIADITHSEMPLSGIHKLLQEEGRRISIIRNEQPT